MMVISNSIFRLRAASCLLTIEKLCASILVAAALIVLFEPSRALAEVSEWADDVELNPLTKKGLCQNKTSRSKIRKVASEMKPPLPDFECYMRIFVQESGAQPTCYQPKGHAKNIHAGFGLCTIEVSKILRKRRGRACSDNLNGATDEGIANQMRCCRQLQQMKNKYFGKYTRQAAGRRCH